MKPIRGGLLSAAGGALLLLALSPAISWATFPGANGRIAYSCDTNDIPPPGICTILPDGTGMERIAAVGDDASWSADGTRLVFVRHGQVFTMDADGGNQTRIVSGYDPTFSPNGRRIVFVKNASLWKVRTDGTDQERIVSRYASGPMYLPNGRRIVFEGRPRGAARDGIWKIRPDGSHLRRLTAPGDEHYNDGLLDVSPGGGSILFGRFNWYERGGSGSRTWVMRTDGSGRRRVPIMVEAYSPSGNRFVFSTGEFDTIYGTPHCQDIHTIRLNRTDDRALTHNCEGLPPGDYADLAYAPSWQPIPQW